MAENSFWKLRINYFIYEKITLPMHFDPDNVTDFIHSQTATRYENDMKGWKLYWK